MTLQGPEFVIAIMLITTVGWLISSWIRARHGYPIENEWSGTSKRSDLDAERSIGLLSTENGALKSVVGRLEERIAVLERIVTDGGYRLDREIDLLRDTPVTLATTHGNRE